MEIFNIHIFEFVLIAGLALVVFGPERLPEVGRFVGKQVARFLAWQQQSPELKMINDVRGEFEREIASLRDELVRTRNQLDVSKNITEVQSELKAAFDLRGDLKAATDAAKGALTTVGAPPDPTIVPPPAALGEATQASAAEATQAAAEATQATAEAATNAAEAAIKAAEIATEAADTALSAASAASAELAPAAPAPVVPVDTAAPLAPAGAVPAAVRPNKVVGTQPTNLFGPPAEVELPPLPAHRRNLHESNHLDELPAPVAGAAEEQTRLLGQVARLMADMQALVGELQERGLIGADWQPPAQANEQESITR